MHFARPELEIIVSSYPERTHPMASPLDDTTPLPIPYAIGASGPLGAPTLEDRKRADVAIVGGGYTGLSTALHLGEAGIASVVLEAREVGWGGSGRAFGQVVPYAKHDHRHLLHHFGPDMGERLITLLAQGPDVVFDIIKRYSIACDAVRSGLLFAAHIPSAAETLAERAQFWQARGAPVSFLDRGRTAALTGSQYYPAALLDERGGCVEPLAYARGLARAATSAGAMLFERSRVIALARSGNRWAITTERGQIEAGAVVLATDAYTDDLWPGLRQSLVPLRAYHVASAPLGENVRRSVMPGGQSLTDTRRLYSGIRLRSDGRLHVSTDGPAFSNDARAAIDKATRRVLDLFPQLVRVTWEKEVAGWVGMSADQYPHLHNLAPDLWAAVGLSGRGIAFGTLLGRELANRIAGRPEHELTMPVTALQPIAVRRFTRPLVGGLMNWYRFLDRRELSRGYLGAPP